MVGQMGITISALALHYNLNLMVNFQVDSYS